MACRRARRHLDRQSQRSLDGPHRPSRLDRVILPGSGSGWPRPSPRGVRHRLLNDDPRRSLHILRPATPVNKVARVVNETSWDNADQVVHALWFHVRAFPDEQAEVENIASMLEQPSDVRKRRQTNVTWRHARWSSAARFGRQSSRRRGSARATGPWRGGWIASPGHA